MKVLLQKTFYLSLILLFLPTFILPLGLGSTRSLIGIIWIALLIGVIFYSFPNKSIIPTKNKLFIFYLIFFVSQIISIVGATNFSSFFSSFKNLFFSLIFLILSIYFIKSNKDTKLVSILFIIIAFINLIFESLIYFLPTLFVSVGQLFLHPDTMSLINADIGRGRVYIESYDEFLIPIIIYYLSNNKFKGSVILLIGISIFSFFSGFRTKILMLILSLSGAALLYKRYLKYFFLFFICISTLYFFFYTSSSTDYFNVIDRLFLENTVQTEISTGRIQVWNQTFYLIQYTPFVGVGLGNYFDSLNIPPILSAYINSPSAVLDTVALKDPHNVLLRILIETGVIGLSAYFLLLGYFIKKDVSILRYSLDAFPKTLVISFWVFFSYAMLNPVTTLTYQCLFLLLRLLIENASENGNYSTLRTTKFSK